MKLYAVTSYHSARYSAVYPMFHYISEDKSKCEAVIAEKKNKFQTYSIVEIETEKELNYLIGQEIW